MNRQSQVPSAAPRNPNMDFEAPNSATDTTDPAARAAAAPGAVSATAAAIGAATAAAAPTPLSQATLDNLAARFRPGGLCLVLLNPDGTVAYHDAAAQTFH